METIDASSAIKDEMPTDELDRWFCEHKTELNDIAKRAYDLIYETISQKDWDESFQVIAERIIVRGISEYIDEHYGFTKILKEVEVRDTMYT